MPSARTADNTEQPLAMRTKERRDNELPICCESKVDIWLPILTNERTDKELPAANVVKADIWLPNRTNDRTESELPTVPIPSTDKSVCNLHVPNIDKPLPKRVKLRTEILLPDIAYDNTEMLDPSLLNCLTLKQDPTCACCKQERSELILILPKTEQKLPHLAKDRILKLEPARIGSRTDKLLPIFTKLRIEYDEPNSDCAANDNACMLPMRTSPAIDKQEPIRMNDRILKAEPELTVL
jgi:hypothetical protein